jgi:hypothetical protein
MEVRYSVIEARGSFESLPLSLGGGVTVDALRGRCNSPSIDPEAIGHAAEVVSPELVGDQHRDRTAFGERVEDAVGVPPAVRVTTWLLTHHGERWRFTSKSKSASPSNFLK